MHRSLTRHLPLVALLMLGLSFAPPLQATTESNAATIDLVRVYKSQRKLQLVAGGIVQAEFQVALGGNPVGPKLHEGDKRTPEGMYWLDFKKADSAYHKAIHISYPDPIDLALAKKKGKQAGGQIMIHGQKNGFGWMAPHMQKIDWTDGCLALSDEDMDAVWERVREGTPILLLP